MAYAVLVEDASRFARDLVTQELGLLALIRRGLRVLTTAGDELTNTSDASRVMMRRIAVVCGVREGAIGRQAQGRTCSRPCGGRQVRRSQELC